MICVLSVVVNYFSCIYCWYVGGVVYGLWIYFFIVFFMIVYIVNVECFVLVVFNVGYIVFDVGFVGGVFG